LISHYRDIRRNTFFSQLINLQKKGPITEHIEQFQKISIRVKKITEDNLVYLFMGTLKENIQHEVHLLEPKTLEQAFSMERKVENKNVATRRVTTNNYREHHLPSPNLTHPKILIPKKMDEIRAKGLCFNCDRKYNKGHKCGEKKLFYIDCEEEEDQELEPSQGIDLEDTTPMIYCHELVGINTPQTLKIQGCIKNKNKR
jgi:hypothetical protein